VSTRCWSLDLEWSSKAHVLKAWSLLPGTITGVEPLGSKRKWGQEDTGALAPLLPFSFPPCCHEMRACFTMCSHHNVQPCHKPKSNETTNHGLEAAKVWAKINLSFHHTEDWTLGFTCTR
jgi:hypothetical protein